MRGRKPIPTKLKIIRGNPGKRPLPNNEIQVRPSVPEPPEHLSERALAEWNRITKELCTIGMLSEIDMAALAGYCQVYGRWMEAEEKLNTEGLVIKTKSGNVIQSPYLGIANRALNLMHKYLVEFGMTPSSRVRFPGNGQESKSKWGKLSEVK